LAATGSLSAAAAFLAACGSGDDDDDDGGTTGATGATGTTGAVLDPMKGTQGGKLVWQGYGDPGGGLELIKSRNAGVVQMASLTHEALLEFAYGQPAYPGIGTEVLPGLAQALPEISPDKLTATFKLRPSKWHNGEDLTSEDVLWTYETLAFAEESAYKGDFRAWLESVEAPDASTFIMHMKRPNADLLQTVAVKNQGLILNRAHQESSAAETSLMGSGPFIFGRYEPPTIYSVKRNPNYSQSPYPYFEEIERLGTSDPEKKVADIISGNVHLSYWFPPEERKRILDQRKDLQVFKAPEAGCGQLYFKTIVEPFSDKRVRQAISMSWDRSVLVESITGGEGQADQQLSMAGESWGFRPPAELKRADLYEENLAEAKKLLEAAGVSLPMKVDLPTWNATVVGQKWVDAVTLFTTMLRNNGIMDATLQEETFGQFAPRFQGTYDKVVWQANVTSTLPNLGVAIYDKYFSPPDGIKEAPTSNITFVNNPTISDLVTKQLEEFDREARLAIFRELEDVLAEEMLHVSGAWSPITYLADPKLKNAQMPRDAYNGATPWLKYWWFGDA
jgi:peptide/nickel transport system substrate-binding protein